MPNKKNILLSLCSGIMLGFAFPPFNLGFLAYFFLIPLLIIFFNEKSLKLKIIYFYTASIISNAIITHWVAQNSGTSASTAIISYIALCIYYSSFWILFVTIFHFVEKKISQKNLSYILIPILWIFSTEIMRDIGPLAGPWINLSLTQSSYLRLIQILNINQYLVTFFLIFSNLCFYNFYYSKQRRYMVHFFLVLMLIITFGEIKIQKYNSKDFTKELNISIGQPVIYPDEKWDPLLRSRNNQIMSDLLYESLTTSPDLIIWPEAALVYQLAKVGSVERKNLQSHLGESFLITGIPQRISTGEELRSYNSAIFMNSDGFYDTYQKIFLVPFAEYVPFFNNWISKMNQFDDLGSFSKGNDYKTFKLKSNIISIMICYDSSSHKLAKKMVDEGAEMLFVITNDSYVGKAMPFQHFEHAKLRAVELGVPVVQSANNGISGIILPSGKVVIKSEIDQRGVFNYIIKF
tara:strand:- start:12284 stop:13672 length:1389 start_codon:yes stop_codon:yes gene_type:complete